MAEVQPLAGGQLLYNYGYTKYQENLVGVYANLTAANIQAAMTQIIDLLPTDKQVSSVHVYLASTP